MRYTDDELDRILCEMYDGGMSAVYAWKWCDDNDISKEQRQAVCERHLK